MTNEEIQIKVRERLNKRSSSDYSNLDCWQIAEAFNKAQLEWFRRQINGINQLQHGDGSSKINYDDTQKLMTTVSLNGTSHAGYFETDVFPDNYLFFSSIYVTAKDDCCPERNIIVYLVDKADINVVLRDSNKRPSFEWGETVAIMADNKLIIYTDDLFKITSIDFSYYRKPRRVIFKNCPDIATGIVSAEATCEFKDDIAEILIDNAVAILAGDIESFNQYTRAVTAVQTNT